MRKSFLILIIFLQFFISGHAISDIKMDEAPIEVKKVASISFEDILKKAIDRSYDLKIADYETLIAKTRIGASKSEYFPKLHFNIGNEYTHNYNDIRNSIVTSVGDSFINPYTRYQSVMGITLSYNVFDFGVRRGRLDIAKEDVEVKKMQETEALQELELNLIDRYTRILIEKKQIELNEEILALYDKNLEMSQRLYKAKEISKTNLNDASVKVFETRQQIQNLKKALAEDLSWLEFYTNESYDVDSLSASNIKKVPYDAAKNIDKEKSLAWRIFEKEIKKKEIELKVQKRVNYPKVNAYGRYYLYGSDHSSYTEAWGDLGPSSYSIGGNILMPLFDGFQNHNDIKKVKLELEQMYIKRDKAVAEWTTRLAVLKGNILYLNQQIEENNQAIKELTEKEKSQSKLASKRVIMQTELNNAKIDLLQQKIEYEKNNLALISIMKAVDTLTKF